MKGRSKILAGSSVLALLAVGGSSLVLGLAYSGELFALSSIGLSTIGPILIATTALFVSLSLVLSISFVRSRHLEKEVDKKEVNKKEVGKKEVGKKEVGKKEVEEQENKIDLEKLNNEKTKVRNFSKYQKEEYFEGAIKNCRELEIMTIVEEKCVFEDVMSKYCDLPYYAASEGGDDVVKYIKTLCIDLDEPFMSQHSSIYYAILSDDTKALNCLINNGADPTKIRLNVESKTKNSEKTPIVLAAFRLQKENVELLLSREEVKANINTVDSLGNTALIITFKERAKEAEKEAQYEITKLLLGNGADPTIENTESETALSLAKKNKCEQEVILLLEEAEKEWEKNHKGIYVAKVTNGKQSEGPHK